MADNKKVVNGKMRTVHTGKKGGKYYVSKGKKVYFGGAVASKILKKKKKKKEKKKPKTPLKSFPGPRRMGQSLSSSTGSSPWPQGWLRPRGSARSSSTQSPLRRNTHRRSPIKPVVYERLIKPANFYPNLIYDSKGNAKKIPSNISSNELKRAINEGRIYVSGVKLTPTKNKRNYKKSPILDSLTRLVREKGIATEIAQFAGREREGVCAGKYTPLSYRVGSQAEFNVPGEFYHLTDMRDGKYHCSCPNYFMKNEKNTGKKTPLPKEKGCKHIRSFVDGTPQRIYPGHDLTMNDRIRILREQLMSGERNPDTANYLDPNIMNLYLNPDPIFFPFLTDEAISIPEREKALSRFKKKDWFGEPYERRSEWYRDYLDNYPHLTPREHGKVRALQHRKDNAYPYLRSLFQDMNV